MTLVGEFSYNAVSPAPMAPAAFAGVVTVAALLLAVLLICSPHTGDRWHGWLRIGILLVENALRVAAERSHPILAPGGYGGLHKSVETTVYEISSLMLFWFVVIPMGFFGLCMILNVPPPRTGGRREPPAGDGPPPESPD